MTLANKLTLARGLLGVITFACLWSRRPALYAAALGLFLAAVVTDWVDGYIARKTGSVSPFGMIADPVADKVLVFGALIAFLHIRELGIPAWAVFLLVVRDLAVGGLRALAGASGRVLAAERWGKWKTGITVACVIVILVLLAADQVLGLRLPAWTSEAPFYLVMGCLLLTWASAALYVRQNLPLLRSSWEAPAARGGPGGGAGDGPR